MIRSFLILTLFVLPLDSLAQIKSDQDASCPRQKMNNECDKGWASISLGSDSRDNFLTTIKLNFVNEQLLQLSYINSSSLFGGNQRRYFNLMMGISSTSKIGRASAFIGPSIIFDEVEKKPFGLAGSTQIVLAPFLPFGFGLDLDFNLNQMGFDYGFGFSFVIEGHK